MAIGIPPYSADALGTLSLQSRDITVLVREGERWRGDWGSRGGRRGGDDGWRFRGDDGRRFRGDDGWRGFRDGGRDWREFQAPTRTPA